jgi:carotenoid cleavage dioxygenase-like enzyme
MIPIHGHLARRHVVPTEPPPHYAQLLSRRRRGRRTDCENCHVSDVVADDARLGLLDEGVRGHALDPENAKALWKKSEEMAGKSFA